MSTAEPTLVIPEIDPADPFFYGFRYIQRNGQTEQVPLTREDVLHPEEGDHVSNNELHDNLCTYIKGVLRHVLRNTPGARVYHDLKFLWDIRGLRGAWPGCGRGVRGPRR